MLNNKLYCSRRRFPWYNPVPTGVRAVLDRILIQKGLMAPENYPGPAFKSEGYRLEELVRNKNTRWISIFTVHLTLFASRDRRAWKIVSLEILSLIRPWRRAAILIDRWAPGGFPRCGSYAWLEDWSTMGTLIFALSFIIVTPAWTS